MPKSCLKCGHENPETPSSELAECPKCGAIYSRVEAHIQQQANKQAAEEAARQAASAAAADAERKRAASRDAYAQNTAEAQRRKLLGAAYVPSAGAAAPKAPTIVKTYKGSHARAMAAFQAEAPRMAAEGYVPTSQEWAPGSYGCGTFLLALLLCVIVIGIIVFIYMLIVKPDGTLSVTYEYRRPAAAPPTSHEATKACPKCAEDVKAAAKVCRYCGHAFE
ncbi:zinc ribbon domain-containing protein [Denitratimonas sp. CY0512]|jgi:predicted  nucleic acid-binding Zn-ribbon protein|uniref:zinc ribbon domain-containing protein n=1 Tax=Denitratimonas sp. CY0512 TaxID=3131940 RepID=UPI0030AEFDB8